MVACKFFLQGYCKFGENCRFEHFQDRHTNQQGNYRTQNRSWQSPSYVASQTGRANSPVNTFQGHQTGQTQLNPLDLAAAIKEDVFAMEEGGQWPLSCYTPLKEIGSFPGFHDTSMEEVRYEAYQAQACGTFDQYVKKIGDLIQGTRLKWGMLKNPNAQIMSVIEKMARGQLAEASSTFTFNTFSFNSPPSPQTSSRFSLAGNVGFATTTQQQQTQGSIFASPQVSTSTSSNFRFVLPQQSGNVGSPYGVPPPSFPSPPPTFASSPGYGQSGGLIFGNTPAAAPTMNVGMRQPAPTGFFAGQVEPAKQASIFGGASQTPATSQGSVFGSNVNPSPFTQKNTQPTVPDLSLYTALVDLTEAEKKEYSAVTFTLGSIPLRPPARELCM